MTTMRPTDRQHALLTAALVRAGRAIVSGAPATDWLFSTDAGAVGVCGWAEMTRDEVTDLIRAARRARDDEEDLAMTPSWLTRASRDARTPPDLRLARVQRVGRARA